MLTASVVRRRLPLQPCGQLNVGWTRYYASGEGGRRKAGVKGGDEQMAKKNNDGRAEEKAAKQAQKPSLYEQLFPDQEAEARRKQERRIPRIPLESVPIPKIVRDDVRRPEDEEGRPLSKYERAMRQQVERHGPQTSILVLRNASKNLVEEDFKRLIPQGQHMEGWTLEQGDILQVIPGRDMITLEQKNFYLLLFSSALSAFTYQGHATKMHNVVASHTPSSILSPMLPPPGYLSRGFDAHGTIQAFSLVPPNQALDLRQLKPPLSPMLQAIVRNGGYPAVRRRSDRMPFEARLTLEGPQLHLSNIRHILMLSGKDRGLSWSGDAKANPRISKWETKSQYHNPSTSSHKVDAARWQYRQQNKESRQDDGDLVDSMEGQSDIDIGGSSSETEQEKRRSQQAVYIVGFPTEKAMQSFVRFWHRRPMEWSGMEKRGEDDEGDLAPVTNVEVLW